jgi:toxin YoeB
MVRKVIWTIRAQNDRKRVFEYWNDRNNSSAYSNKLNILINQTLKLICKYPLLGKSTDIDQVRIKIMKNYLIIYKLTPTHLIVLTLWDCNQDLTNLKL